MKEDTLSLIIMVITGSVFMGLIAGFVSYVLGGRFFGELRTFINMGTDFDGRCFAMDGFRQLRVMFYKNKLLPIEKLDSLKQMVNKLEEAVDKRIKIDKKYKLYKKAIKEFKFLINETFGKEGGG